MSNSLVIQSASDAYGTQTNNRATVASLTFLAYDICLTFPDEVAHIWTKPRSSYTKWAFLVLRYFTLANVFAITLVAAGYPGSSVTLFHRQPYCGPWYAYQAIALQVITAIMESIMCLRVYALYGRTRTIATILITLFAAEEISMAAALALFLPHMKLNEQCIADHIPIVSIVFGVAPIAFELVLLAMTWSRVLSMARRTTRREKMLVVLVRDGTWTFLAVFWTFALNGLFYLIITGPMNSMAWTWQFAVSAFAGCRLVLHMHTAGTPHPSLAAASHQHHRRASSSSHAVRHPRGPRARRRTWTTEDEYSTGYGYGAGDAGINHLDTHFALTTFDPGPEFPPDSEHGEDANDGVGELGSANPFFSQRMGGQEPWSARSPRPSSSMRPGSSGTGTTGLTGTTVSSSTGAGTAAGTMGGRPGSVGRQDRS